MIKDNLISLQQKVTLLRAEGKYKDTIENAYELLEQGTQFKDYKSILTAYINLAASYYCIGDIEEALLFIDSYEEICDKHGDDADKLNCYNILFLLLEYNKDIPKAKDTLEKSIALSKKLKMYNILSNSYSNYSHLYIYEKNYEKALEAGLLGLEMAKLHEPSSPILEFRVNLNIARAYTGLKDFDTSIALIHEMINNPVLDSFIREKSQFYDLLGNWYSENNLYNKALEAFTHVKNLVESYKDVYLLKSIQEERCRLCEIIGDINLGYKIQKEYITLLKEISERELESTALKLEIKRRVRFLEKQAITDQLTGIFNRSYIENLTNTWLKQAYSKNENVTCLVFDIDNFKSINDKYGHLFGDEIIKEVSSACSQILREDDLIGRYGGDEFIIILKGASLEDGRKKAEQILEAVRSLKIYKDGKHISITISIGVTNNLTVPAVHFNELFNAADMRLYKAKHNGRNQICAAI
jgi:diguanylate cyclase (GGDEF)-like protein